MLLFMVGAAIFAVLVASYIPGRCLCILVIVLLGLYSIGSKSLSKNDQQIWLLLLTVFVGMMMNVSVRQIVHDRAVARLFLLEKQTIECVIKVRSVNDFGATARLLTIKSLSSTPHPDLTLARPGLRFNPGDRLQVKGYLYGMSAGQVKLAAHQIKLLRPSPLTWIYQLHERLMGIMRYHLPGEYADLLTALILGTYGVSLTPGVVTLFRDLGLLHLLVVSGAQVALMTQLMLSFLQRLLLPRHLIFVLVLIFNGIFLVMTGGEVSIVRAVFMMQFSLWLTLGHRQRGGRDVLLITALVMLGWNPAYLFKLGFILSFLATLALIEVAPRLEKVMPMTLAISLAPLLLSMPVILYAYQRLDWLSLLANMLVGPLIEVIVLVGFVGLLLGLMVPLLAHGLFLFVQGLIAIMLVTSHILYSIPNHTIHALSVNLVNIVAYYGMLLGVLYFWQHRRQWTPYAMMVGLVLIGVNVVILI